MRTRTNIPVAAGEGVQHAGATIERKGHNLQPSWEIKALFRERCLFPAPCRFRREGEEVERPWSG